MYVKCLIVFLVFSFNAAYANDKQTVIAEIKNLDNRLYEKHQLSLGFSNQNCPCNPQGFFDSTSTGGLENFKRFLEYFVEHYKGGNRTLINNLIVESFSPVYDYPKEINLIKGIILYYSRTYGIFSVYSKNPLICAEDKVKPL